VDAVMFKFFRRFGGEVSSEQKLMDMGRSLPAWAQPIWKWAVEWFIAWVREQRIQAEMKEVDEQVKEIDQQWTQVEDAERTAQAEAVAARIQQANPDAAVSVIQTAMGEGTDAAILIERPPDGSKAQDLLGGAVEIRSPWMER
jgi:hypothetical protein